MLIKRHENKLVLKNKNSFIFLLKMNEFFRVIFEILIDKNTFIF